MARGAGRSRHWRRRDRNPARRGRGRAAPAAVGARRRPGGAAGARTGRARQSRRVARYTARRRLAARHAAAAGPGTRAMTQPAGTRPDVLRDILRRKHEEVTERAARTPLRELSRSEEQTSELQTLM